MIVFILYLKLQKKGTYILPGHPKNKNFNVLVISSLRLCLLIIQIVGFGIAVKNHDLIIIIPQMYFSSV